MAWKEHCIIRTPDGIGHFEYINDETGEIWPWNKPGMPQEIADRCEAYWQALCRASQKAHGTPGIHR